MKNLFNIKGKIAIVTGGSRGIGEMIAKGYLENGAKVYITARKVKACVATAERLSKIGSCIPIISDLATLDGIEKFVEEISRREEKIDILVNNAGATWGAALEEYPEDGWDKVMDINLKSPFFLVQKLFPLLKKAADIENPSRVINISSVNGLCPPPVKVASSQLLETYAYSSSKAAMIMLTRHLAGRLTRDNILVNAIAPGPFESDMMAFALRESGSFIIEDNPRKRIGTPEDIAGVAIFLASRASAYMTGSCIPCDGGLSAV